MMIVESFQWLNIFILLHFICFMFMMIMLSNFYFIEKRVYQIVFDCQLIMVNYNVWHIIFTRDATRNNSPRINTLFLRDFLQLPKHYRSYFPHLKRLLFFCKLFNKMDRETWLIYVLRQYIKVDWNRRGKEKKLFGRTFYFKTILCVYKMTMNIEVRENNYHEKG